MIFLPFDFQPAETRSKVKKGLLVVYLPIPRDLKLAGESRQITNDIVDILAGFFEICLVLLGWCIARALWRFVLCCLRYCRARSLVDIRVFVRSITVMSSGLFIVELAHLSRVKTSLRRMRSGLARAVLTRQMLQAWLFLWPGDILSLWSERRRL